MLLGFVALCLLVAGSDAAIIRLGWQGWSRGLLRYPVGMPPGWLLALVWTALYLAMAIAAWRVWCRSAGPVGVRMPSKRLDIGPMPFQRGTLRPNPRQRGLVLWGWQLAVNAVRMPVLFALHRPLAALGLIGALALLVVLTIRDFRRVDRVASLLMAPYLTWLCYATWLTAGIAWLNPG